MNTAEIDIDKTPYLYYSISQPNNSPFTFALYTDRVWFLGRDGAYNNETSLMTTNSTQEYYTLPQRKIDGNQTGCIDLRNWISGGKLQIKELKLYGATDGNSAGLPQTDCTINYLFFGSEPVKTYGTGWGEPATPNNVILGNAAVGGEVTIDRIDYYVVGRGTDRDWLKINDVTFAYDNS